MNLLTRIEIVASILLTLSVASNIVLFFYSRNLLAKLIRFSNEVFELREETTSFANHLKDVYELEMFYGDMTLGSLMEHAKSFRDYVDSFDYIYILEDDDGEEDNAQLEEEG